MLRSIRHLPHSGIALAVIAFQVGMAVCAAQQSTSLSAAQQAKIASAMQTFLLDSETPSAQIGVIEHGKVVYMRETRDSIAYDAETSIANDSQP